MLMTDTNINQFINKYISSVWQLELILLLKRSEEPQTADELCSKLYMVKEVVEAALNNFVHERLLQTINQTPKAYIYQPDDTFLREAIDELETAYTKKRAAIINMIFATPCRIDVSEPQN